MPIYTATDYEPLDPGLYVGRLVEVREAKSEHGTYYRWVFEIRDEDYRGRQITRERERQVRAQLEGAPVGGVDDRSAVGQW